MKAKDLLTLSDAELQSREKELKKELFMLRFNMATGQLSNPLNIRQVRKDIARVKTVLHERSLKQKAQ